MRTAPWGMWLPIGVGIGLFSATAVAQQSTAAEPAPAPAAPANDVSGLSLDDLLNTPVAVAASKASTLRETPGIVTVITREEIISSGARDLMDVLFLVPGFSFPGVDVENVADFGFRGMWGHEGKILLMVDGQSMDDEFYGNNAMGMHFPIEQAQSIEIIRGPGSVVYGGSAELAVINIITRPASELNGAQVSLRYGQMPTALGEATVNVAAGLENVAGVNGLDVTAFAYVGHSNRSDGDYTDFTGNRWKMAGNEMMNPNFFDVGVRYKDLRLRFIWDDYHLLERDSYVTDNEVTATAPAVETRPASEFWRTIAGEARYDLTLGKLTLTPLFSFKQQNSFMNYDVYSYDVSHHTAQKWTGRLTARYDINDNAYAMIGGEYYADRGWEDLQSYPSANGGPPIPIYILSNVNTYFVEFWNVAGFGELQYKTPWGTFTAGARGEHFHTPVVTTDAQGSNHAAIYDSFVPRIAWTKVFDRFHAKALYSQAFRGPGFGDIALANPAGIQPEHAQVVEVEAGYEPDAHNLFTLNAFDIVVKDPLVFQANVVANTFYYFNYPRTGTQGFEFEYRAKYGWGYAKANASFYTAWSAFADGFRGGPKNDVPYYQVPGDNTLLQGFPALKVTLSGKVNLWRNLSLSPALLVFSSISGQLTGDGQGNGIEGSVGPLVLVNAWLQYTDLLFKGLDLAGGVYNGLNSNYAYFQPYSSNHAPLNGPRRDFALRLAYRF